MMNNRKSDLTRLLFFTLDVQTQAMYQMMDEGFVGLIFSCFNEDSGSSVRFSVILFLLERVGWEGFIHHIM